jgi:M6 family metalloprotease-like protein
MYTSRPHSRRAQTLRRAAVVMTLGLVIMGVMGLLSITSPTIAHAKESTTVIGRLLVVWGDDSRGMSSQRFYLVEDQTQSMFQVLLDEQMSAHQQTLQQLNGHAVTVVGSYLSGTETQSGGSQALVAQDIQPLASSLQGQADIPSGAITGSQPWVSVLCKFADIADEPKPLSYFANQYSDAYPGLDSYWREASYNAIDLQGSLAVGWFTLPHPRSYYIYDSNADGHVDMNFETITNDCVAVADAAVYFPSFAGINLMFNSDLDDYAWGISAYPLEVDGVVGTWYMTWEPPWGYSAQTVMAHEMGHGLGFPHSGVVGLPYGQGQGDRWDIMGDGWADCANLTDPTYGCLPQHTVTYHKDSVGWIAPGSKHMVAAGSQATILLEQTALPQTASFLMGQIAIRGSSTHFYTAEMRRKAGYDVKLPGEGVIIHDVVTTRSEPAQLIDVDNNGDTGDGGAIWLPGEAFTDLANNIDLSVNANHATGAQVTIRNYPGVCEYFGTTSLSSLWQWTDPLGGSTYSLTASNGNLRISTPNGGRDLYLDNLNAPRLLQPVLGNFRAKTKVTISQHATYQGAGILVWQDAQNYLRIERGADGYGIAMWSRINDVYTGEYMPYTSSTVYLKVERSNNDLTTWYSENDVDWTLLGTATSSVANVLQVGPHLINAWQDDPLQADFAYFELDWCATSDYQSTFLPLILRN